MEEPNQFELPHLDRIGLFQEMSYHQAYVPHKISFNDSAKKGKQMMTTCTKSKAGTQVGYFDKEFPRAFQGEAMTDIIRINRRHRLEKAKLNLPEIFKYTSPTKKPCGKGSNYGTFMTKDYKIEHFSYGLPPVEKAPPQKMNFYTNPPKKGTGYGYPKLTIGEQPPYFLENEYEELKNKKREPKTKPTPRSFQPYRAGIFKQEYFDPNPFKEDDKVLPPREEKETEEKKTKTLPPFIPSNPPKKDGGMKAGCLNPFPEHTGEIHPRIDLIPRGVKAYLNDKNQMFRPVPGVRPYPVKSIIDKNVQRRVTPKNFDTIKGVVYCK